MRASKNLFLISFFSIFFSAPAFSGLVGTLQQNAEVVRVGDFHLRGQFDIVTNNGGGLNGSVHLQTGLYDDLFDIDVFFGGGKTDLFAGTFVKFNLLPDLPGQVALAFLGGVAVIRDDIFPSAETFFLLNTGISISKKLQTAIGIIDPFATLLIEWAFISGGNSYPLSIALGARWKNPVLGPFALIAEYDVNIKDSLAIIGLGVEYAF